MFASQVLYFNATSHIYSGTDDQSRVLIMRSKCSSFCTTPAQLISYVNNKYGVSIPRDASVVIFPLRNVCRDGEFVGTDVGFLSITPTQPCPGKLGTDFVGSSFSISFIGRREIVYNVPQGSLQIMSLITPIINPLTLTEYTHICEAYGTIVGSCGFCEPVSGFGKFNISLVIDENDNMTAEWYLPTTFNGLYH